VPDDQDSAVDLAHLIGHALADVLDRHEHSMLNRWVVVLESVRPTGDRILYCTAPVDALAWDTLGLLDFAITQERAALIADNVHGR
jgi:hypothetical protein